MGVQVSPPAQMKSSNVYRRNLAYILGVALGDGNLSNPNKRAVRLRVTCDIKYPKIIEEIKQSLGYILPQNKISEIKRQGCIDISIYSNTLESLLGWKAVSGSKYMQSVCIPEWVLNSNTFSLDCLRGLFQTDGSIYVDRSYLMINYTSNIPTLTQDVEKLLKMHSIKYSVSKTFEKNKYKYTIRITSDTPKFIKLTKFYKK